MRTLKIYALATIVWMAAGSTAFAQVQLTIQNGRVSIVAKDATIRQILTEWARVGQTKIVNVERLSSAPLTLQLTNVPELEALDVLLRSVSGYLTAPRPTTVPTLSAFDRIVVMPASATPRTAAMPGVAAPPSLQPAPFQPQLAPPPDENTAGDDRPTMTLPPPRGPVFSTFPVPQVVSPQQNGAPASATPPPDTSAQPPAVFPTGSQPSNPFGGTPRPGMVMPAPPQPGQQPINPAARPPESN